MVKNWTANAGDMGLIPGLERSPGEENGNPLHCSCLENPMDRGAWQSTVHGVTKSWTRYSDWQQQQHVKNLDVHTHHFLATDTTIIPVPHHFHHCHPHCHFLLFLFLLLPFLHFFTSTPGPFSFSSSLLLFSHHNFHSHFNLHCLEIWKLYDYWNTWVQKRQPTQHWKAIIL